MTFPQTPRSVLTELYIDDAWVDISTDVQQREDITIGRGKTEWANQAAPCNISLSLNNRSGKYSPRNPLGTYFNKIGRNTPIRLSTDNLTALKITSNIATLSTPDSAGLSVTSDLDLRAEIQPNGSWDSSFSVISKYGAAGQRSWYFNIVGGALRLVWSADGTATISKDSTVDVPFAVGERGAVRVTLDVNNGAAGNTVTFYTSNSMTGTWTQLGAPVVTAGTTSIKDSTAPVDLGESTSNPFPTFLGRYLKAEIRNGIAGTVVGSPDLTTRTVGASSFADTQGNTWTLSLGMSFVAGDIRFWGEVSSFPGKWDTSGNDAWVPIEAAGLLRRLNQGVDSPASGLQDVILSSTGLYNYWPLGGQAGTTYSLDIGGFSSGSARFRSEGGSFIYGVDMNTFLGSGMAFFNSTAGPMRGDVGSPYNYAAVDFVFQSSELGDFDLVVGDYSDFLWTVNFDSGVAQVSFTDPSLGPVGFSPTGVLPELLDDAVHHCRLELLKNATATDWRLYIDGVSVDSGSQASYNLDGVAIFRMYLTRTGTESWVTLGHIAVWSAASQTWPTAADLTLAMNGYAGETAGVRIERILGLAGYSFVSEGDLDDTVVMGPQYSEGLLTQLRDAESTDLGILTEPRDSFGLLYRTRASLYNQTPSATIDLAAGELADKFEPVEDDQAIRNDITAVRRNGDSFRIADTTSALSVQAPPLGVGRYKDEVTFNVQNDEQLPGMAAWVLHLGTVDEARYPAVTVNLANPNVATNAALVAALLATDIGDKLVITSAQSKGVYDDIELIVFGYKEFISAFKHTITFNCSSASPYSVAVYDTAKYDTAGSELASGVNSSATALSVADTGGTLWTRDPAAFPFDIRVGGERMTVTNITGASSPQAFTVTRHVNGVTKAHLAGADVRLWNTPRYAL